MKIYQVPTEGPGITEFVQHVRTLGNRVDRDEIENVFYVHSRNTYASGTTVPYIVNNEIAGAMEELIHTPGANPGSIYIEPESPPAASSLSEILRNRQASSIVPDPREEDMPDDAIEDNNTVEKEFFKDDDDNASAENQDTADDHPQSSEDLLDETDPNDEDPLDQLRGAAQHLNHIRKNAVLSAIEQVLQISLVTDTDVLSQLSETADLKKTLSAVLNRMGISVSITAVSKQFRISNQRIEFHPGSVETPLHYRQGVSELFRRIDEIDAKEKEFESTSLALRKAEVDMAAARSNASEKQAELKKEIEEAKLAGVPRTIFAPRFQITWVENNVRQYLGLKEDAIATKGGDYPNNALSASTKRAAAYGFTDIDIARRQVTRMKLHPQNCDFFSGMTPDIRIARLGYDYVE